MNVAVNLVSKKDSNFLIAPHNYLKLAFITVHLSPTNVQNLATIFTTIFLCPHGLGLPGA